MLFSLYFSEIIINIKCKAVSRFWVEPRGRDGQTFPSSNDVKTLFEDYGRVENCQLKVDKKVYINALVAMTVPTTITGDVIALWLDGVS